MAELNTKYLQEQVKDTTQLQQAGRILAKSASIMIAVATVVGAVASGGLIGFGALGAYTISSYTIKQFNQWQEEQTQIKSLSQKLQEAHQANYILQTMRQGLAAEQAELGAISYASQMSAIAEGYVQSQGLISDEEYFAKTKVLENLNIPQDFKTPKMMEVLMRVWGFESLDKMISYLQLRERAGVPIGLVAEGRLSQFPILTTEEAIRANKLILEIFEYFGKAKSAYSILIKSVSQTLAYELIQKYLKKNYGVLEPNYDIIKDLAKDSGDPRIILKEMRDVIKGESQILSGTAFNFIKTNIRNSLDVTFLKSLLRTDYYITSRIKEIKKLYLPPGSAYTTESAKLVRDIIQKLRDSCHLIYVSELDLSYIFFSTHLAYPDTKRICQKVYSDLSAPDERDPNREYYLCKHARAALKKFKNKVKSI